MWVISPGQCCHGVKVCSALSSAQLVSIRGLESDAKSPVLLVGGELLRVFDEANTSFGNASGEAQHAGLRHATGLTARQAAGGEVVDEDSPVTDPLADIAARKKLVIILLPADML